MIKRNNLPTRYPGLKHELERPHLTHTSVQLEMFAKNYPVFQTVKPEKHQIDVIEMLKKKFKKTGGLPLTKRNSSTDFINNKS